MDGHNDKVWALDISSDGRTLVSGGADSQIVVWKDTTQMEEEAKRATEEQNIMMEQKLANHLRYKEYDQALEIALELQKPRQALKVIILWQFRAHYIPLHYLILRSLSNNTGSQFHCGE
jgi:U3 small nucleolar RNA-associated protein 13